MHDSRTSVEIGQRDGDKTTHGLWGRWAPPRLWDHSCGGALWRREDTTGPQPTCPRWATLSAQLFSSGERCLTLRNRVETLQTGPRLHGLRDRGVQVSVVSPIHKTTELAPGLPTLPKRVSTALEPHSMQGRTGLGAAWGADPPPQRETDPRPSPSAACGASPPLSSRPTWTFWAGESPLPAHLERACARPPPAERSLRTRPPGPGPAVRGFS